MYVYINIVGETCSQTSECDSEQETHHDQSNVYRESAGWRLETKVSIMKFILTGYVTVIITIRLCYSDDYYNQVMLQSVMIITIRLCYRDYYNQVMLQWLLQSGYVTGIITIRLCYSDYYNQVMLQWLLQSVLMRLLSAVCPPNLQAMSTHRYSSHVLLLFICKNEKEFNVFW